VLTTLCHSLPESVLRECPMAHRRQPGSVLRCPIVGANKQRIRPGDATGAQLREVQGRNRRLAEKPPPALVLGAAERCSTGPEEVAPHWTPI